MPTTEAAMLDRLWYGRDGVARMARAALTPVASLYGAATLLRNAGYSHGLLKTRRTAVPALSIGNLSVGGTGKTPLAAWSAAQLVARGARPAVILRGYGDDEPLVHRVLNPGVPVIAMGDRVAACERALAAGANVAVLDDAFQHRRASRVADVVLVSADRFTGSFDVLPAGPYREPASALRRAQVLVLTRKAADGAAVKTLADALRRIAPAVPQAVVSLVADGLVRVTRSDEAASLAASEPISALAGCSVLVIAAIGDPSSFAAQLVAAGARVTLRAFPDHHKFTDADLASLAAAAAAADRVVCTLKDAVKLGPLWPRGLPTPWYVSQRVVVDAGVEALDRAFDAVSAARLTYPPAPSAGPT